MSCQSALGMLSFVWLNHPHSLGSKLDQSANSLANQLAFGPLFTIINAQGASNLAVSRRINDWNELSCCPLLCNTTLVDLPEECWVVSCIACREASGQGWASIASYMLSMCSVWSRGKHRGIGREHAQQREH